MNEKMQFVIACILVIVCTVTSAADLPATSEEFHHTVVLDANETIVVHWNYDKETITFEVHCRTAGWCGIGFSDNGNMIFADIVIGWVKDGKGVITDRHGDDHNTFPPMDDVQDVKLLWSEEAEGWTKLKFSRDIVSCDVDNDRDITGDTTKVIFGWGETDPSGDDVTGADYHGYEHRGARSMILLGTEEKKVQQIPEGEDHHSFDIRVRDFHVPVLPGEEDTYYNCRMFEFPQYDSKHHLVKVEPIVTPGNELNVHHMILYECTGNLTGSEGINQNGECFSKNMPKDFNDCGFAFQAWAIGGGMRVLLAGERVVHFVQSRGTQSTETRQSDFPLGSTWVMLIYGSELMLDPFDAERWFLTAPRRFISLLVLHITERPLRLIGLALFSRRNRRPVRIIVPAPLVLALRESSVGRDPLLDEAVFPAWTVFRSLSGTQEFDFYDREAGHLPNALSWASLVLHPEDGVRFTEIVETKDSAPSNGVISGGIGGTSLSDPSEDAGCESSFSD